MSLSRCRAGGHAGPVKRNGPRDDLAGIVSEPLNAASSVSNGYAVRMDLKRHVAIERRSVAYMEQLCT
ncbi:hypothetical protein BN2475_140084 [Paraburkholderia ribeironis]|uniref:Uncharacterized protein n=1 Tax=Paraburkholderia ribeironis TaxID=1247936 RepID=A0A1N7RT16_9BURK|nr:hypothetical protein BN2475_140084 [Paraburkholderia ribeironis]